VHKDSLAAAGAWAREVATKSPDAVRAMKSMFDRGYSLPVADALALEAATQVAVMSAPNQAEAVRANLEKRAPEFADTGRNFAATDALKDHS
jgi:enoyl-CoA hydratase/carnithine racemase